MSKLIPLLAPICYREPANLLSQGAAFKVRPLIGPSGKQLHWLDELCRGSLDIPPDLDCAGKGRGRSVIMLLTGPPGTGKSTFALELACSLASKPLACTENGSRIADKKAKVLYVSAEETGNRLKDKAVANGWAATGNIFICSEPTNPPHKKFPPHGLVIRGKDTKVGPAAVSPENCGGLLVPRPPAPQPPPLQEISRCMLCQRHLGGLIDVLVLDSLNIYSPDPDGYRTKLEKFNEIQAKIAEPDTNRPNPRLIIVVVDTSDNQDEDLRYCEFCADILLRFGWEEKLGYTLRTFEIVKMRGQSHAWGKQRVKLYPHATDGDGNKCKYARGSESPYLSDKGGFFVFPSMHTYISHFSHSPAPIGANPDGKPLHFPYPVNGLDRQISESVPTFQGLPAGGCTAVIGPRGALKSHLAYYFLLAHASGQLTEQAVDNPPHRNCLLVSLRDDQESAIETLAQIAESQNMCGGTSGRDFVENLIKNDWLEILENDIGMISPEEFFHKIYVAVHRPRANRGAGQEPDHKWNGAGMAQIVIVAGLDQLEARFPLIAQESIFVPALIQFFRWNKVCSMIVSAVGESATPAGQSLYGLLPMSDLLLHLSPIDRHNPPPSYRWPHDFPRALWVDGSQQVTRVETRRVPGGQIGEKIGYLFRKVDNSFHYVR